jgi:integrase
VIVTTLISGLGAGLFSVALSLTAVAFFVLPPRFSLYVEEPADVLALAQVWFHRLYSALGFSGASSHSGRRTFVTRCAKNIIAAGGSLRDVQELAGHASLATTQRYVQGDTEAKRRVVDL